MNTSVACGLIVYSMLGAAAASAQYSYNMPNPMAAYSMGLMNNVITSGPLYQQMREMNRKAGEQEAGRNNGTAPPAAAQSAPMSFSPGDGTQSVDVYVEWLSKQDPAAAKPFRATFGGQNITAIFSEIVRPFGLTDHDVADAMTARLIMRMMVASGGSEPSPQSVRTVRNAVARGLTQDPKMASPGYRNQLGSEAELDFVVTNSAWRAIGQGQWPADAAAQFRQNIAASLTREGVDLHAMGFAGAH